MLLSLRNFNVRGVRREGDWGIKKGRREKQRAIITNSPINVYLYFQNKKYYFLQFMKPEEYNNISI